MKRFGSRHPSALAGTRIWLIGASSGIGAALALELQRRGANVAITARRAEQLDQLATGTMIPIPADVTDPDAIKLAERAARRALGDLDTVIWCAGYWKRFDATAWDRERFARHIAVNLLGLNNVLAAVVPAMVERGSGHIVGIASVAGYRGLAGSEAYGATKAAQINLLEALRASLTSHGIRITTVCPGFVRTPMTAGNTFPMPFLIEPDQAAKIIVSGLERGRMEIIFPLPMALTMKLARILPVRLWAALSSRIAQRSAAEDLTPPQGGAS
jgi:short-subunit dehydrogenase